MRRFFLALGATLEALVLIAMGAIHYFGHARMGMARTLVFFNAQVRQLINPAHLTIIALATALIFAGIVVVLARVRKPHTKVELAFVAFGLVLFAGQVAFALRSTPSRDRAYVVVVLGFVVAQLFNTASALFLLTRPRAGVAASRKGTHCVAKHAVNPAAHKR